MDGAGQKPSYDELAAAMVVQLHAAVELLSKRIDEPGRENLAMKARV